MTDYNAIRAACDALSAAINSPADGVYAMERLADLFCATRSELQAAHQDRQAGACWGFLATDLNRAAASLRKRS